MTAEVVMSNAGTGDALFLLGLMQLMLMGLFQGMAW